MVKVKITAGICGLTTVVTAEKGDDYEALFQLDSQCPHWREINDTLGGKPINMLSELFKNRETGGIHSQVIDTALDTIPHISCPVTSGILKAMEVCAGLALPKDATIEFIQ